MEVKDSVVREDEIGLPDEGVFVFLPPEGREKWMKLKRAGEEKIESGRVAFLILNGGMATRFSGVVKGVDVKVFGKPFLYWKLKQIERSCEGARVYLMNSAFTNAASVSYLEKHRFSLNIKCFVQNMLPRLTVDGRNYTDDKGNLSYAGAGHGDMLKSFVERGMMDDFVRGGCEILMISNVDNLGAYPDPVVTGCHVIHGGGVSVEVARRKPHHRGGIVVKWRGKNVVLEGFRWPEGFDGEGFRFFNTNTFYIDRQILQSPPHLPLHHVRKKVGSIEVIQKERILCEITHFVQARYIVVPDDGDRSRFIPVKDLRELEASSDMIESVLKHTGLL